MGLGAELLTGKRPRNVLSRARLEKDFVLSLETILFLGAVPPTSRNFLARSLWSIDWVPPSARLIVPCACPSPIDIDCDRVKPPAAVFIST